MLRCAPSAENLYGRRLRSMCVGQATKKKSYALQRVKVGRDVTVATLWSSELRGALIWCVDALESSAIYAVCNGRHALVNLLLLRPAGTGKGPISAMHSTQDFLVLVYKDQ